MRYLVRGGWVPIFLLLSILVVHFVFMLPYDLTNATVFLNADRSVSRWETIQAFLSAVKNDKAADFVARHGVLGDYAVHAALLEWNGKIGLISSQVGMTLASGWGVYRIGRLIKLSVPLSTFAASVYFLLPHTLVFPHQLISEALHTPLIIISLWLTAEYLVNKNRRFAYLFILIGALLVGVAALIRPVTLLWPLIVGLIVMHDSKRRIGIAYIFVAYFPILIWMSFVGIQTGKFGLGEASHDMGHNLYDRIGRITETMPLETSSKVRKTYLDQGRKGSLKVSTYIQFATEYPTYFAQHTARDILIFVGKSGIERISIDYLEINIDARSELQDSHRGWRPRLEKEGVTAAIVYLWKTQGAVFVISIVGSILIFMIVSLAAFGGFKIIRRHGRAYGEHSVHLLLIALPLYILLFSQVVDAVQSRHRAPAEAAIVLLFAIGIARIKEKKGNL